MNNLIHLNKRRTYLGNNILFNITDIINHVTIYVIDKLLSVLNSRINNLQH